MQTSRPLWIIGIDGLEPRLLDEWGRAGYLPTLASLRKCGASGRLLSTPNMLTASAWPTIATGANPGSHGIYNFQERVPGEYRLKLPTANDRKLPAFWELASAQGLVVVTACVPMTYPARPLNGVQVVDWLVPSPLSDGFVYPPSLRRELLRRFPHSFWLMPVDLMRTNPRRALRGLLRNVDRAFELFRYLLQLQPADLFFGVVREADVAGHLFWGSTNTAACDGLRATGGLPRDALLSVYQRIDSGLAELLSVLPDRANLLILSDHGMGANPRAPRCVAPLLEAAGLMVPVGCGARDRFGFLARMRTRAAELLPWSMRRRLKPWHPEHWSRGWTKDYLSRIDFDRSQAFSYLSLMTGEVWLNLKGRDPRGMVAPGQEQQELEADMQALFASCKDAETGQSLVKIVWRRDDLFWGPEKGMLADLHIEFDLEAQPRVVCARWRGRDLTVTLPEPVPGSGMHRAHGAFIACGPSIRQCPSPISGTLMDIAPTALMLLGLPEPGFMEGRVLTEILTGGGQDAHADNNREGPLSTLPYTDDELELVEQRLAQLGYL